MNITKVFFDTEFTGLHHKTTLISIGLVSECGKTFYCELDDYDKSQLDDFTRKNVIANLIHQRPKLLMPTPLPDDKTFSDYPSNAQQYPFMQTNYNKHTSSESNDGFSIDMMGTMDNLKIQLSNWLKQFNRIEVWADVLSYDWVLFCKIFGTAFDVPNHIYYIPFDLSTLFKVKGIDPNISREYFAKITGSTQKHNSLFDAMVVKECYFKAIAFL